MRRALRVTLTGANRTKPRCVLHDLMVIPLYVCLDINLRALSFVERLIREPVQVALVYMLSYL